MGVKFDTMVDLSSLFPETKAKEFKKAVKNGEIGSEQKVAVKNGVFKIKGPGESDGKTFCSWKIDKYEDTLKYIQKARGLSSESVEDFIWNKDLTVRDIYEALPKEKYIYEESSDEELEDVDSDTDVSDWENSDTDEYSEDNESTEVKAMGESISSSSKQAILIPLGNNHQIILHLPPTFNHKEYEFSFSETDLIVQPKNEGRRYHHNTVWINLDTVLTEEKYKFKDFIDASRPPPLNAASNDFYIVNSSGVLHDAYGLGAISVKDYERMVYEEGKWHAVCSSAESNAKVIDKKPGMFMEETEKNTQLIEALNYDTRTILLTEEKFLELVTAKAGKGFSDNYHYVV